MKKILVISFFGMFLASAAFSSSMVVKQHDPEETILNDNYQHYFVMPALPVNQLTDGEIVALPKSSDILYASVSSGELPAGMQLHHSGLLTVNTHYKLLPGSYTFEIETYHEQSDIQKHAFTYVIKDADRADRNAVCSVTKPKAVGQYKIADQLAVVRDPDGAIVEALVVKGNFPAGTQLLNDGRIVVADTNLLATGDYSFIVAVADHLGGASLMAVSLRI